MYSPTQNFDDEEEYLDEEYPDYDMIEYSDLRNIPTLDEMILQYPDAYTIVLEIIDYNPRRIEIQHLIFYSEEEFEKYFNQVEMFNLEEVNREDNNSSYTIDQNGETENFAQNVYTYSILDNMHVYTIWFFSTSELRDTASIMAENNIN